MAGTGCESTHSTIALTRQVAALGADVALLISPSYYKSKMDAAGLTDYYLKVAEASPIPVSIYNMPGNTNVDMSGELIVKLSQHPNILGVKDSGGNLSKLGEIVRYARPGFQVLAGSAGFLYPALCLGAVGGVLALANIAPQQCCDITGPLRPGEARRGAGPAAAHDRAQRARSPPSSACPGLKAAMDMLGYRGGAPRSPLLPLPDAQKPALQGHPGRGGDRRVMREQWRDS